MILYAATTVALNGSRGNGHGPPDQCHSPNAMVNEDCERLIPDIPLPCFKPNMIRMNLVMFELVATGGALYNFTEPRMLCDGTISSIQYCFMASETMERQDIFRFLVIKQSHQLYTLDYDVNVTLSDTSAQLMRMVSPIPNSKLFYCDKMQLQYRLFSPYNYSFGIRATNSNISLLRFKEGVTFPQVSIPATEFSFQVDDFTDYIESTDFAFRDSTLLLLRLQIGITDGTQ